MAIPGTNLALLAAIGAGSPLDAAKLSAILGTARTTTINKLNTLIAAGFVDLDDSNPKGLSPKGALLRDLASLLLGSLADEAGLSSELEFILSFFDLSMPRSFPTSMA
jgi:DNA-binding IclR family transcriptional regulator